MVSKAPNDDAKGKPAPDSGRNDPAIDPDGTSSEGSTRPQPDEGGDSNTAQGNSYSPDFEPERRPDPVTSDKPRDADIDTDGG